MKSIRIGCGSGGCTYERMEPAIELVEKGELDYLIFECLAERTIADAQRQKMKQPKKGYNPMLQERMETFLPLIKKYHIKIVSNMGGANTNAAVEEIIRIAKVLHITGLKIAMISGDDISSSIHNYDDTPLWNKTVPLKTLSNIISANVYLGADSIRKALDDGADIVITGRVADPALFVGPILHEFNWTLDEKDNIGQALLVGHLLECCGQLTGGYYADPGYKNIPNLHILGHPIAEITERGEVYFTKVPDSGGRICVDICKEQLLYEIGNPAHYITPDGIADFSNVTFKQLGKDLVYAKGATSHGCTDTYKVNIGYMDGYLGIGEISFGGTNALDRAKLATDIILKRWHIINIQPQEYRIDYIGYNSLYKDAISSTIYSGTCSEIRLRIAVRTTTEIEAVRLIRELQCMYINGPAGSSGIASFVEPMLSVENILVPRVHIHSVVTMQEV